MSFFKKTFVVLAMIGIMIPSSFAFAAFGLEEAAEDTDLIQVKDTKTDIPDLIGSIVGVALSFVGAIFFLLILYAGFLWMTAFGATDKVDKAKNILEHAAVGLIIVLAAYAISRFVFSNLPEGSSGVSTAPPTAAECQAIKNENDCTAQACFWFGGTCDVAN